MENEITKNSEVITRVQVYVSKPELKAWKKHFMPFGTKTEFERETGIARQTLNKVLKAGKGEKTTVGVIRSFVGSQKQVAN
jgi:hypothetical protein